MAYMIPNNIKLVDRAIRMICEKTGCSATTAEAEPAAAAPAETAAAPEDGLEDSIHEQMGFEF